MIGIGISPSLLAHKLVSYPLDGYSGIQAVYSTRRLLSSYTGDCLKLRRGSDDADLDFGFDGSGDLDTAAILLWLGGNDGYIDTWYDQSGNGHDATQATDASQPLYDEDGINSCSSIEFDQSNDFLALPKALLQSLSAFTFLTAFLMPNLDHDEAMLGVFQSGVEQQILLRVRANKIEFHAGGQTGTLKAYSNTTYTWTDPNILVGKCSNGNPIQLFVNGTEVSSYGTQDNFVTLKATLSNTPAFGRRRVGDSSDDFGGELSEFIVFSSALSDADRGAVEAIMTAKWIP